MLVTGYNDELIRRDEADGTKTLLVVLGDHGMTDGGNHGGASKEETETGCIFLSSHYKELTENAIIERIEQVDVAPTVALLLGLEVPKSSTGRFITSVLPESDRNRLDGILRKNAMQLATLLDTSTALKSIKDMEHFLNASSKKLRANVGEYKMGKLVMGVLLALCSLLSEDVAKNNPVSLLVIGIFGIVSSRLFDWVICILLAVIACRLFLSRSRTNSVAVLPTIVCIAYATSQFASTYIEEEHFFWNFVLTSLILVQIIRKNVHWKNGLVSLLLHRLIYYWNSTGFLYQNDPDMRSYLLAHSGIDMILWMVSLNTIFWDWYYNSSKKGKIEIVLINNLILFGALYKLGILEGVWIERLIIFLSIGMLLNMHNRSMALSFIMLVILKRHNAIPIAVLTLLSYFLRNADETTRLCLVHASYFLLGPCHIIASVDFSPAYIGLTSYHPIVIPTVAYLVIWAGPFMTGPPPLWATCRFRSLVGVMLLISLAIQRHHISVWTVFAPRILFEYGWLIYYSLSSLPRKSNKN